MIKIYIIVIITLLGGCVSNYRIERHNDSFIRRMPQMNRIETGRLVAEGSFSGSATVSYAVKEPGVLKTVDSSFESKRDLLGNEVTIVASTNNYGFESRLMVSGEGLYGFTKVFSGGISLDVSLGSVAAAPNVRTMTLYNSCVEGSMFFKFAKQFNHIGISIKPEATIIHLFGERVWNQIDKEVTSLTATEKLSYYTFSVGSSSIIRYEIFHFLSPYVGLQLKSQPFPTTKNEMDHEVGFGVYGGVDFQYRLLALSPFVAIPLGSTTNHYKSPVSAGMQCTMILSQGDDE